MTVSRVVSVENMRKSYAHTISHHITSAELMYKAAMGIYNAVQFTGRVAIVCGSGNNGGDGYALACILCKNGIIPTIFRISEKFSKDGLYYYKTALSLGAQEANINTPSPFTGYDIIVDCLLGTGFSGEVKGELLNTIELINLSGSYIISADINSGINGDSGVADIAVNSDLTVSIGAYKTGMFLNDAPYYIGSMVNADIGIHFIEDEYHMIDYSHLHLFEGYGSEVMTTEELSEKYGYNTQKCDMPQCVADLSQKLRKTVVVTTEHSAIIADLKYIYFCADYAKL